MFLPGKIQSLAPHYERVMEPLTDGDQCVTAARPDFLIREMKVEKTRIKVLYDCPPAMF